MKKEYYENRVCIVTGASTGIGFALSKALLEMGATVYMVARTKAKLAEAQEALGVYGDRARIHAADVSDNESVRQLIDNVFGREGRIDFLFNNAGIGSGGLTEHASLKAWKRVIDTDLWGVIYAVHAILPIMLAQGSGHIVNTSSIGGLFPLPYQTLYCTAKYGVVGLSETLRHEMLPRASLCPSSAPGQWPAKFSTKAARKPQPMLFHQSRPQSRRWKASPGRKVSLWWATMPDTVMTCFSTIPRALNNIRKRILRNAMRPLFWASSTTGNMKPKLL